MTQEEMAEKLCCNKSLISQYENDKVDIKGSVIVELAELLGTTTGYLLSGEKGNNLLKEESEWRMSRHGEPLVRNRLPVGGNPVGTGLDERNL